VLLEGLGGNRVGQGADLELVVAEEAGVVGGGELGGEFADLGVDSRAEGSGEVVDLGLLLGRPRLGRHGDLRSYGWVLLSDARIRPCVQRFHQLSRRPPELRIAAGNPLTRACPSLMLCDANSRNVEQIPDGNPTCLTRVIDAP
jgi:hypothetical protein